MIIRKLIEKNSFNYDRCNIEDILWSREKYWHSQFFTNIKGMNSVSDLYSAKRQGCRKKSNLPIITLYVYLYTSLVVYSSYF